MKRYILKPNREGWPPEIPLEEGRFARELDVVEEEIPHNYREWYGDWRHKQSLAYRKKYSPRPEDMAEVLKKPLGFDKKDLPKGMELIEVDT